MDHLLTPPTTTSESAINQLHVITKSDETQSPERNMNQEYHQEFKKRQQEEADKIDKIIEQLTAGELNTPFESLYTCLAPHMRTKSVYLKRQLAFIINTTNNFNTNHVWKWNHRFGNSHINFSFERGTCALKVIQ